VKEGLLFFGSVLVDAAPIIVDPLPLVGP